MVVSMCILIKNNQSWQEHTMPLRYIHIVDNDPTAALVTQLGLQARLKTEAEVTIAATPRHTQHFNGPDMEAVDLLIVDPGSQSQAATRLIRTLQTDCPQTTVLVLTAYDSPLLRTQMRSLGVQHYLAKPVDLFDLEQVVRQALQSIPLQEESAQSI
jgi:DNA-binding NarL/FixJ family response regulator